MHLLGAALTFAIGALALPQANHHVVVERRSQGSAWVPRMDVKPAGNIRLPVRVGLTQTNLDLGDDLLMKMSDPASQGYGQHMSMDEVSHPH